MNGYELSRNFWDFSFCNPEKIKPIHSAIFFFSIEHCNRLGWKEKFGFPTTMVMDAIGISNYASYKKGLEELVEWGFIKMIQVSKNQYSANIISLTQFVGSTDKALDKALRKHDIKQHQSIASIDKQLTSNQEQEKIYKQQTGSGEKTLVIEEHLKTLDSRTTRYCFYSSLIKNIYLIQFNIDTKQIDSIEKKLLEFRTKLGDDNSKLELENFWEHHGSKQTQMKSLIFHLNTWLKYSITK